MIWHIGARVNKPKADPKDWSRSCCSCCSFVTPFTMNVKYEGTFTFRGTVTSVHSSSYLLTTFGVTQNWHFRFRSRKFHLARRKFLHNCKGQNVCFKTSTINYKMVDFIPAQQIDKHSWSVLVFSQTATQTHQNSWNFFVSCDNPPSPPNFWIQKDTYWINHSSQQLKLTQKVLRQCFSTRTISAITQKY